MGELRIIYVLVREILKLMFLVVRGLYRLGARLLRSGEGDARAAPPPVRSLSAPPTSDAKERAATERAAADVRALATRARPLEARCAAEPLCASLLPTLRDFVLPEVDAVLADVRRASTVAALRPLASRRASLEALTRLLSRMAGQRCDPSLAELTDDADALAAACYQPVVDYCRANDLPLSSNRTATVFGDDCSPWLDRIDDPTGLAILHLPSRWLAEVHRWPAIGHEVGHDFYSSVEGLDAELLLRHGLSREAGDAGVLDGREGVSMRDIDRIVANWRHELVADAFGVMMLGPAYVVTTAEIFARPSEPRETLTIAVDGATYEVHPPGHLRVVAVCRLLARMGYGALGVTLEQKWRAQHGDPAGVLLPVPGGWLRLPDEPFLDRIVAMTVSLYGEGFSALRGIPLSSLPGFDFGPREHEEALRARDTFLADGRASVTDARLLIAGAVLAWAERPQDGARLLRAARLAIGKLPLRVPGDDGSAPLGGSSMPDLLRYAFLLDLVLSPPVSARLRRVRDDWR